MHVNDLGESFSTEAYWAGKVIIDGICYFAVPVFFMISGANLIDYRRRYNTATFFKKRFYKAVLPFLIWSVFGMIYCFATKDMGEVTLTSLLMGIINTEYIQIYWFFIPLFMVYLVMPLFSAVEHRQEVFGFLILAGLLLNYIIPWFAGIYGLPYSSNLQLPVMGGYVIYVLLGYYLDHYEIPMVLQVILYLLGIYGLWYLTAETLHASLAAGFLWSSYKGYLNLPAILYGSALFLAIKRLASKKLPVRAEKAIRQLSGLTLGIYLVHRGLIELVYIFTDIDTNSLAYRLVGTVVIFGLSGVLVKLMQKIPVLRRIVP
jgi:surface polysaccharide O-acyltransferase-like enzyme